MVIVPSRRCCRGACGTSAAVAGSASVFELGHGLDCVLRTARKDEFSAILLELVHRNRDIMASHAQEAAGSDNGIGYCLVRRDDDVVDLPDGLASVVEDLF